MFEDALRDLGSFLRAIEPYLRRVVLCGGWVPFFYRQRPLAAEPAHGLLLTYDFDVVAPSDLPPVAAGTLHDLLLSGGFVAVRNREPPVVYYQQERWGRDDLAPVYGELLTPLVGSEHRRSGEPRLLGRIQDGVYAQRLRYLDLLLHDPLTISAGRILGLDDPADLDIRIPNPAAYVLQKALALEKRRPIKQRKDLAHVFEVATLWFHEADRVREMAESIASRSRVWSRWVDRGGDVLRCAFESVDADGTVSAEQVLGATAAGHLVSAVSVSRITGRFLERVFPRI